MSSNSSYDDYVIYIYIINYNYNYDNCTIISSLVSSNICMYYIYLGYSTRTP